MDYNKWEKNLEELKACELKYKASSKKVNELINFEENFTNLIDQTRAEDNSSHLCEFLKTELPKLAKKYFNYFRLYFEKALEVNCDDDEIWQLYIETVSTYNKNRAGKLELLERACKCCYNNILFWIYLLREMEISNKTNEEINQKIKEAFNSNSGDPEFYSEILKYNLEYNCRIFNSSQEHLEYIRSLFEEAIPSIKSSGNPEYLPKIYHIWAEFEVYKIKDKSKMNEIMDRVVKSDSSLSNWRAYIYYEKVFGDAISIRKIYCLIL